MKNQNFIGVGGLLFHNNGFLLVKHNYGEYQGNWIIPGGHVDQGEHIDAAIIREVKEETTLDVKPLGIMSVRSRTRSEFSTDCYIVFVLEYLGGTPQSDHYENDDARFFTLDEINKLPNIIPLSKFLIHEFHKNSEHYIKPWYLFPPYTEDRDDLKLYL